MENSVGVDFVSSFGLGKGSYQKAFNSYAFQDYLRRFPVRYRNDEYKLGHFLSGKLYVPEDKRAAHFLTKAGKPRKNPQNNEFNVEHIFEVGQNPYHTRLSTRFSNDKLKGVTNSAKKVFDETGDPAKAAQSLMETFENLDLVGAERYIQTGEAVDDFIGISKGLRLTDLFEDIVKNTSPETRKTLMGAAQRLEKDPVFLENYKRQLGFMKEGGRVKKFMGGYLNPEDIGAE